MLLKISALYLWYFILVFVLAVLGSTLPFLQEGTLLGDILIRRPYQWDFEFMFTMLFAVWGIFLWKESKTPQKNSIFISFTGWAFVTQAISMIILALLRTHETSHFILDSIPWFMLGIFLLRK